MTLSALVVALMLAISPRAAHTRDARAIASAIAVAVAEDAARGYADAPLEAASLVVAAWEESRFRVAPPPSSWDSRSHRVCGYLQLACGFVDAHPSLVDQARRFLTLVHSCGLSRVSPGPHQARTRLAVAMGLVGRVTSPRAGAAEAQRP